MLRSFLHNFLRYSVVSLLLCASFSRANDTADTPQGLTFQLNRLVDDTIVAVTEKDWPDSYLLVAVGYTGCPDICPTTMLDMRQALHELDKVAPKQVALLQPLFITIDPQSDTVADITEYTSFFDSRIVGLRADDYQQLNHVVRQLGASYGYSFDGKPVEPPLLPKGYTVMHSVFIYLYSPERELLDVYPYNMPGAELAKRLLQHFPH